MITLTAHNLFWIGGEDDPADHCAHGEVEFRVNDTIFIWVGEGDWNVSGASLYLLRTIQLDHSAKQPIAEANQLFPHCAHFPWPSEGRFKVECMGCNSGIDIYITHNRNSVVLESPEGRETVSQLEWQKAVLAFARQIREFYDKCTPKERLEDAYDRSGWLAFWTEWEERYTQGITGEEERMPSMTAFSHW